jgi:hypothetical protein
MLFFFSRISTWLFIEMIATFILAILNMIIPILMMFTSYRNLINFYFSSTALSSSLINFLYLFYLIQTIRSKILSEMNCRAIYYLQTSCIVVLGMIFINQYIRIYHRRINISHFILLLQIVTKINIYNGS